MDLIEDLIAAYRILAAHDVIDAYGHVSVRSERNPNRYFLAGHIAPELVEEKHIIEYDLDSNPLDAKRARIGARALHPRRDLTRRGPRSIAVVHNHSPSVVPFSVTKVPMRADLPHGGVRRRGTAELRDPRRAERHRSAGQDARTSARRSPKRWARNRRR